MKDTITLAELRKTELYRKEQTRPLREFLMENIDVLKLADEVEMWGEDLLALNMRGGIPVIEAATMLRQQKNEIEGLKSANRFIQNFAEEQHKRAVTLESELDRAVELYTDKAIENEALRNQLWDLKSEPWGFDRHPVKELTDEEITDVYVECMLPYGEFDEHEFARAILRKAQEK